jgi:hypothetical protein
VAKLRIGQFLVAEGMLSDDAVVRALAYQRKSTEPLRLGTILLKWEVLSEEAFLAALGKFHGCAYVTWPVLSKASPHALRNLPALQAIRLEAVPYAIESGTLWVAFRNPSDLAVIDEASQIAGRRVLPAASTEVRLALAQQRFYGNPMPFQFKPVLQKLERRRTPSAGAVLAAAVARESQAGGLASAPVEGYEISMIEPPALPRSEIAESTEAVELSSAAEPIPPIEIPMFPAVGMGGGYEEPRAARSRDEVLAPILEALLGRFSRVILLGIGRSAITGWGGGGPGLSPARVAMIRIPRMEENLLAEVAKSGVPHIGPVERERFPRSLRSVIGRDTCECAVFPIRVLDTVAGLLYADRLGVPLPSGDFAALARGAASAASVLSDFLRRGGEQE